MKKLEFIIEPSPILETLERLQTEVDGRKEILSYLIQNNLSSTESFEKYQTEYLMYYKEYNKTKSKFEIEIIQPYVNENKIETSFTWFLDFESRKVTISW